MSKRLLLAVVFSFISATLASGQAPSGSVPAGFDSRWTPYLGCWTIVQNQRGVAQAVRQSPRGADTAGAFQQMQ